MKKLAMVLGALVICLSAKSEVQAQVPYVTYYQPVVAYHAPVVVAPRTVYYAPCSCPGGISAYGSRSNSISSDSWRDGLPCPIWLCPSILCSCSSRVCILRQVGLGFRL